MSTVTLQQSIVGLPPCDSKSGSPLHICEEPAPLFFSPDMVRYPCVFRKRPRLRVRRRAASRQGLGPVSVDACVCFLGPHFRPSSCFLCWCLWVHALKSVRAGQTVAVAAGTSMDGRWRAILIADAVTAPTVCSVEKEQGVSVCCDASSQLKDNRSRTERDTTSGRRTS